MPLVVSEQCCLPCVVASTAFTHAFLVPHAGRYPVGGIGGFVKMGGGKVHNDFFTSPEVKKIFQDHITFLVNRKNTINGLVYKARMR